MKTETYYKIGEIIGSIAIAGVILLVLGAGLGLIKLSLIALKWVITL